jgi:hypothetical protein
MNRVLDPVFTKSVEFIASRQIDRPAPEHPIVVCDLTLKAAGVAAAPAPTTRRTGSAPKPVVVPEPPKPAPAAEATIPLALIETPRAEQKKPSISASAAKAPPTVSSTGSVEDTRSTPTAALGGATVSPTFADWPLIRERWFAPAIAAAGVALMGAVFFFARATRRRQPSLAVSPRPGDAVFVEVRPSGDSLENLSPVTAEAVVSEATTATDNAHNVRHALWRDPRVDFGNQEHGDPVRAGVLAHLRHLMREKLFVWLSKERTHLIDSHETGTRQVLGLEERLEKIKEQFQDRLISQEERIAELDRELQAKDKVIRTVMGEKIRQPDGS